MRDEWSERYLFASCRHNPGSLWLRNRDSIKIFAADKRDAIFCVHLTIRDLKSVELKDYPEHGICQLKSNKKDSHSRHTQQHLY